MMSSTLSDMSDSLPTVRRPTSPAATRINSNVPNPTTIFIFKLSLLIIPFPPKIARLAARGVGSLPSPFIGSGQVNFRQVPARIGSYLERHLHARRKYHRIAVTRASAGLVYVLHICADAKKTLNVDLVVRLCYQF